MKPLPRVCERLEEHQGEVVGMHAKHIRNNFLRFTFVCNELNSQILHLLCRLQSFLPKIRCSNI